VDNLCITLSTACGYPVDNIVILLIHRVFHRFCTGFPQKSGHKHCFPQGYPQFPPVDNFIPSLWISVVHRVVDKVWIKVVTIVTLEGQIKLLNFLTIGVGTGQ
jgi:hypothetical protein